MNKKRFFAIVKKETLQVLRDPSTILIAVILPLLLLFLMGYAVSLDAKNIPIGIISKSNSHYANTLISSFRGSSFFITNEGKDKELYKDMIKSGKIKAVLEIDSNFGKGDSFKMQLLVDATEPNVASFVQKFASEIIMLWAKDNSLMSQSGITIESRYWFNTPLSSQYFLLPGSIVVVMTLIGTLLTALVIAREWERGTMEALMATPATISEIVVGKVVPYFFLAMLSLILCFFVVIFWYKIPFYGSLTILFLMGALYLLPSLCFGLLISTITKNQFVAAQIALVASFLPALLLSGFLFEIENMPTWLQYVTYIVPAKYFVGSIQTIFLAGNIYEIFVKSTIGIAILGILLFIVIMKKTKKSLEP
ncbi:MAG: ABC transporter permease [Campylobacteraceae bacterium]